MNWIQKIFGKKEEDKYVEVPATEPAEEVEEQPPQG